MRRERVTDPETLSKLSREPVTDPAIAARLEAEAPGIATGVARSALGQGLAAGFGDEIEAFARSRLNDTSYDNELATVRGEIEAFSQEYPVLSTGAEIGGAALGSLVPGGAVVRGATFGARAARGAAAGAAYGAAYGFGSGEGADERRAQAIQGAGFGGVAGLAAPAAVSATGAVLRGAKKAAGRVVAQPTRSTVSPGVEASRRVSGAIGRDRQLGQAGLSDAEMALAKEAGQPVVALDRGGETTRALARSAANTSPEGRAVLERTINTRFEGQSERVSNYIQGQLGNRVSTAGDQTTREALESAARKANKPAYARAYQEGAGGVWNENLEQLMQAPDVQGAIKKATRTGANRATAEGFQPIKNPFEVIEGRLTLRRNPDGSVAVPNLQFWDHVKRNLDDQIGAHLRAGRKAAAADAMALKNQLVAELDGAVPAYAEARAGAARFFGAQDALEAGRVFVGNKMTAQEGRRALGKMSEPERRLFREGFFEELIGRVKRLRDRRNVVDAIYGSPDAKAKIEVAVGKGRAKDLEGFLRVEQVMDLARAAVTGNSTTARQLAEMGLAGGLSGGGMAGYQFLASGDVTWQAVATASFVGAFVRGKIDQRVAQRVAEDLVSDKPEVVRKALTHVVTHDKFMRALRALDRPAALGAAQQATERGNENLR